MKKKTLATLSLMLVSMAMIVTLAGTAAHADVIWEPEDDFYRLHANDCDYVNRSFYANGETGYMEIFTEPGGRSLGFTENGNLFHVQFSYVLGKETWGYVEFATEGGRLIPRGEGNFQGGWARLKEAAAKFDAQSFDDRHAREYEPYEGDYTELKEKAGVVIWSFPNSGESLSTLDEIDENLLIDQVYTDLEGLRWGHISYYYGWKNVWVCLDKPTDESLGARDVPSLEFYTPEPGFVPKAARNELGTGIILGVAAVVLLSALLLAFRKKKLKENIK